MVEAKHINQAHPPMGAENSRDGVAMDRPVTLSTRGA